MVYKAKMLNLVPVNNSDLKVYNYITSQLKLSRPCTTV